jgi:hypothetical protein
MPTPGERSASDTPATAVRALGSATDDGGARQWLTGGRAKSEIRVSDKMLDARGSGLSRNVEMNDFQPKMLI